MSAPVTHGELALGIGLIIGGLALIVGLFTLADAMGDINPSQRRGDIGCGFYLALAGAVILIGTAIGYFW